MLLVAENPVTLEEMRNVVKYRTRLQATPIKQDMGNLVDPFILNMGVLPLWASHKNTSINKEKLNLVTK